MHNGVEPVGDVDGRVRDGLDPPTQVIDVEVDMRGEFADAPATVVPDQRQGTPRSTRVVAAFDDDDRYVSARSGFCW
ncbi:hypothetical protein XU06_30165 (plasmid) [Rhodococcus erythropolis]|uniref:hypothetical protein n=1 Tax=Rhodococcus erythropolis TaxID=1833 RepID=UPI00061B777A|nr:hypothetical protein [Rhodococcus erythropolis]AKE01199.1 hypothetical protein XU06_30165 [Rhodococcus erythropolis]